MIKALLFDFDGLILETEGPIYEAWLEVYQSYGLHLPLSLWATIIGTNGDFFNPYRYLEEQLGAPVEWDEIDLKRIEREEELILKQPLMPGVLDYLDGARRMGLKTAVASSSSIDWIEGHLARLGILERFDCIRTRDNVKNTKPDPELFLSALACLGVGPEQAIVFEDSPNGVLAARKANIFSVAVPNKLTGQLSLDMADMCLPSLAIMPLETLLEKVAERTG